MQQVGTLHGAQRLAERCTGLLKFKMSACAYCGHQLPTRPVMLALDMHPRCVDKRSLKIDSLHTYYYSMHKRL